MGQIHGPNLGSPAAIVTSVGELLVTGSVNPTTNAQTSNILIGRDSEQILTDILKEMKIMNVQLESMTGIQIKHSNIIQ